MEKRRPSSIAYRQSQVMEVFPLSRLQAMQIYPDSVLQRSRIRKPAAPLPTEETEKERLPLSPSP